MLGGDDDVDDDDDDCDDEVKKRDVGWPIDKWEGGQPTCLTSITPNPALHTMPSRSILFHTNHTIL